MAENRIWKFPLDQGTSTVLGMPGIHRVLAVQIQGGTPTVWAMVDPCSPPRDVEFRVFCTGAAVPDEWDHEGEYVGTFQDRWFVGHVFKRVRQE